MYYSSAMGFPVRTKGTGNTEHMFSQWGLVGTGTGNREQVSRAKRDAPQGRRRLNCRKFFFGGGESLREQGTGTGNMPCSPSVPGTCSGTTPGKPIGGITEL